MDRRFAVRGVIIDLDGTLLDTAPDLVAAANAMRVDQGLDPLPFATIARFVGKGAEMLVHRALTGRPDGRAPPDRFAAGYSQFLTHYRVENGARTREYPDARAGLQAMRSLGLRLACVTNKPRAFTEPLLERFELGHFFEAIVSGDTLPQKKPDPAPLLHASHRFGIEPARMLAIGDSLNDAQAARAAGMPVLLVGYGYNEGRDVHGLDVDGIVATLLAASQLMVAV
jgi:phosphoglycolate phosphatase